MIRRYGITLGWALRHQRLTLLVATLTLSATILLYIIAPKGFFPAQDTGLILGISEAQQTASFKSVADRQRSLVDVILKDSAVQSLSSFIGVDGVNMTANSGRIQINLKPLEERKASATDVIRRLQPELAKVEGVTLYMQPAQDLTVEDRVSRTQYQYTLEDANPDELQTWTTRLVQKLQTLPQLRDVASDQQNHGLQVSVAIDRDTASRLGVTPQMIDDTLYDAFGQRQISTIFTQSNQYHVVLEAPPEFQRNPDALKHIYIRPTGGPSSATSAPSGASTQTNPTPASGSQPTGAQGASVEPAPLSSFAHFETAATTLAVNHQGQFPATTISFNLAPGAALGDAVRAINAAKQEIGLPASIQAEFQGAARAFQASLTNEPLLILAALLTVYIVLGVLYESYIHPITILSTLPSAGVGAILALLLFKTDLTIIALIGIILLIGIVKKNAIMMIDFALEAERERGKNPEEAIYEACLLRFRPTMMTTMAALLGGLPLALGMGTGSELRRPLGITIVGGLIVSQMLTQFTTPVIYLYIDRFGRRLKRIRDRRRERKSWRPAKEL